MCYYTNWSQYRQGAEFFPENLDPSLCTHLIYAFAKLIETEDIVTPVTAAPNTTVSNVTAPPDATTLATESTTPTPLATEPGWGLGPTEWNDLDDQPDWNKYNGSGIYTVLNKLKETNPGLKVSAPI